MTKRKKRVPTYRLHKASGQGVVTIRGKDHYLGKHGTAESNAEYDRILMEHLAGVQVSPSTRGARNAGAGLTVAELAERYLSRQRQKLSDNRNAKSTLTRIRLGIAHAENVYGHTLASEFGPRALLAVRQTMLDADLSRTVVNERTWRIKRMFRWAVTEQLVPLDLAHGLDAIENLKAGEFGVRADKIVHPVSYEDVEAILRHLARQYHAMVLFQWWTGARSGEVVQPLR